MRFLTLTLSALLVAASLAVSAQTEPQRATMQLRQAEPARAEQPATAPQPSRESAAPARDGKPTAGKPTPAKPMTAKPMPFQQNRRPSQWMMQTLKPAQVPASTAAQASGANDLAANTGPVTPKYEIADCGTNTNPMICCSYKQGDSGSTCELFKLLCENAGGTAKGGEGAATCSDW